MKMVALNAYENDSSACLWKWWWLLAPLKMVALNAYENDGSEHLWMVGLNTYAYVALNAYENGGGSKHRN